MPHDEQHDASNTHFFHVSTTVQFDNNRFVTSCSSIVTGRTITRCIPKASGVEAEAMKFLPETIGHRLKEQGRGEMREKKMHEQQSMLFDREGSYRA